MRKRIILEGWAFDPGRPHAALSALGATTGEGEDVAADRADGGYGRRDRKRGSRMKRIALTLALIATLAFAGTAAAAPSVTPNGSTGACNMLSGYINGGLANAFANENPNGWDGKWGAVYQTTGNTESDGCK